MSDIDTRNVTTPVLGLNQPDVGGDVDDWGNLLNANAAVLDKALLTTGGTLTGPLSLAADPTVPLGAATKAYVDGLLGGGDSGFLPLSGGTVTGSTTIRYDTTGNNAILFTPVSTQSTDVAGHQMTSQMIVNTAGGTRGAVYSNALFGSSITGAPNNYIWSVLAIADYSGTGGNGQHVASYNQAIRRTQHSGGTTNNPEMFCAVFECLDYTNSDSAATNTMNGIEVDMTCGNTDSANARRAIGIYLNHANATDQAPVVNLGLHIAANTGTFNAFSRFEGGFNIAAIDLRNAAVAGAGGHTIWFGDGGHVAWNTGGTATTVWNAGLNSGAGGVEFSSNVQVDGALDTVGNTVVGGALVVNGHLGLAGTSQLGGLATFQSGISCQPAIASGPIDLSKHLALYGSVYGLCVTGGFLNHVADTGSTHAFYAGATRVGAFSAAFGMQVGDTTGPTWTFGSAAPVSSQPIGSLYSRIGGALGATLYVSRGAGTWAAIAGV